MTTPQPTIEWGFHAVTPRIIRTGYKDLTPMQKWLYVCLKDLCGETGTCYRALRVLAEETGISTGMLSESIPILHKAGLIHAEKKKRSAGGKEVWHITIVDIWQANAKAHPSKRSHSEQTTENVHTVNEDVHRMNDNTGVCSCGERECSLCETEEVSLSSIITEEVSREERGVASATAPALPILENVSQDDETTQKREVLHKTITQDNQVKRPPAPPKANPVIPPKHPTQQPVVMPISPEAQRILDDWTSLFKRKIVINQGDIIAAEHLVQTSISKEELGLVRLWYRKIGVCLADIDKKYTQWLSLQEAPPDKKGGTGHAPPKAEPYAAGIMKQFHIKQPQEVVG
jgi:hypothetical protein